MQKFEPVYEWNPIPLGTLSFLVMFPSRNMMLNAAHGGRRRYYNFFFWVRPWSFRDGAIPHILQIRVRLNLTGVPLLAWDADSVRKMVTRFCLLEKISTGRLWLGKICRYLKSQPYVIELRISQTPLICLWVMLATRSR